jgi:hypothetical protein
MSLFERFLNEDIKQEAKKIEEPDIIAAVDRALGAFWKQIQISFPNVKTRDLTPEIAERFRKEATDSVNSWLQSTGPGEKAELPPPQKGSISTHNSFNQNPFAKQAQQWNIYT